MSHSHGSRVCHILRLGLRPSQVAALGARTSFGSPFEGWQVRSYVEQGHIRWGGRISLSHHPHHTSHMTSKVRHIEYKSNNHHFSYYTEKERNRPRGSSSASVQRPQRNHHRKASLPVLRSERDYDESKESAYRRASTTTHLQLPPPYTFPQPPAQYAHSKSTGHRRSSRNHSSPDITRAYTGGPTYAFPSPIITPTRGNDSSINNWGPGAYGVMPTMSTYPTSQLPGPVMTYGGYHGVQNQGWGQGVSYSDPPPSPSYYGYHGGPEAGMASKQFASANPWNPTPVYPTRVVRNEVWEGGRLIMAQEAPQYSNHGYPGYAFPNGNR